MTKFEEEITRLIKDYRRKYDELQIIELYGTFLTFHDIEKIHKQHGLKIKKLVNVFVNDIYRIAYKHKLIKE